MPDWPWNETRFERRCRIAQLYRDALAEHAPTACAELDNVLDAYSQHWITGTKPSHIDPTEPMTAKQIADWTNTTIQNVTNRVANYGITPIGRRNGRKTYWLADFDAKPVTALYDAP